MFYRSERLLLRPIWPEDWPAIKVGIADLAVLRNLSSAPHPYGDEDAQKFVRSPVPPLYPRFLVTRAGDAAVLGTIGLDATASGEPEMGYWIAQAHWGHGFATEAGRGAIAVAKSLGHKRIVAAHYLDNPASGKVLRKIGFTGTGTTREQYSLGRGEAVVAAEYELEIEADHGGLMHAA